MIPTFQWVERVDKYRTVLYSLKNDFDPFWVSLRFGNYDISRLDLYAFSTGSRTVQYSIPRIENLQFYVDIYKVFYIRVRLVKSCKTLKHPCECDDRVYKTHQIVFIVYTVYTVFVLIVRLLPSLVDPSEN